MNTTQSHPSLTIITHEFHPTKGGIATFVEEMARGCQNLGHAVEVWAPRATLGDDRTFPYPVVRVPVKGTQDLACQARMAREMIRNRRVLRRRIVYLPEPGPVLAMAYLQFIKAFRPGRLILTFHGSEILSFWSRPLARLLVGRLIHAADRVTTPSRFSHQLLCRRFAHAAGKAVITPGALRADFFHRDVTRVKTTHKTVIVTVGRLHPRKGQIHVIEALDRLPDALARRVEYWIVGRDGKGNYESLLRQRAARSRVPVTFLSNIDDGDLELLYRRADIFALASVNHRHSVEGFGLAFLEASAFGLPVVGTRVGGVAEAVCEGETGLLVPPRDAAALADALASLIADASLRNRLGTAGRAWARRFSWDDSARILLDGFSARPAATTAAQRTLQSA